MTALTRLDTAGNAYFSKYYTPDSFIIQPERIALALSEVNLSLVEHGEGILIVERGGKRATVNPALLSSLSVCKQGNNGTVGKSW